MANTPYLSQDKRDYINQHKLEDMVSLAINNVMRDEPAEPQSYLAKHFSGVCLAEKAFRRQHQARQHGRQAVLLGREVALHRGSRPLASSAPRWCTKARVTNSSTCTPPCKTTKMPEMLLCRPALPKRKDRGQGRPPVQHDKGGHLHQRGPRACSSRQGPGQPRRLRRQSADSEQRQKHGEQCLPSASRTSRARYLTPPSVRWPLSTTGRY
jgi:hypothetical protein